MSLLQLKLEPAPTFVAPVAIPTPGEAPNLALLVTFRHKGRKALADWVKRSAIAADDVAVIDEIVAGWDELVAGLPYSRDALAELFDRFPAASVVFAETYRRELLEAREKNSVRSPSPGRPAA